MAFPYVGLTKAFGSSSLMRPFPMLCLEVFWIEAEVTKGGKDTHNGLCPDIRDAWKHLLSAFSRRRFSFLFG